VQFLPQEKEAIKKILFARLDELGPDRNNHRVEIYDAGRALDEAQDMRAWLDLATVSLDGETYDKVKAVLDDILLAASFAIFATFGRDVFAGYSKIGLVIAELFWLAWQNEVKHLVAPPDLKPHPAHINPAFERHCAFVCANHGTGIVFRQGGNVGLFSTREMSNIPSVQVQGVLRGPFGEWSSADFWNPKTQTEDDRQRIWKTVTNIRDILECFEHKRKNQLQKTTLSPVAEGRILRNAVVAVPAGKYLTKLQLLGYCLLLGASKHLDKFPLQILSATLKLTPPDCLRWSHESKVLQVTIDDSGLGQVLYQEDNQQCFKTFQAPIEPLMRVCESDYPLAYDQRTWNNTTRAMADMLGGCVLEVKRALPKPSAVKTGDASIVIHLDNDALIWALNHLTVFVDGEVLRLDNLRDYQIGKAFARRDT